MRYLSSISLALIVLMALACTAAPAPTPDVPLLDEKTVKNLTIGFLHENTEKSDQRLLTCFLNQEPTNAQYIGKDIWVVVMESEEESCTFTVHDKEAHVILPQQGKTAD